VTKTVLELDLVGYSGIARMLEQSTSSETVAALNDQIQGFIDQGLRSVGLAREGTVMATTGDGAILVFDHADQAHRFAVAVHEATRAYNSIRTEASAKRRFRIGAATGDITLRPRQGGGHDMAGVTIANAVRLETAAAPGTLLIDLATYNSLSPDLRGRYEGEEEVSGKHGETFRAHRCVMDAEAAKEGRAAQPRPREAAGNRRAVVEMFGKLYPEDKLDTLTFLLEMPIGNQPARTLPHIERWNAVLRWVSSPAGPGLTRLEPELRYLLETESP
jgi:class 3 adenylate cyclase